MLQGGGGRGGLEGRYNFQNHLKEGIHFYSQYLVGTFVTVHRKTYFNDGLPSCSNGLVNFANGLPSRSRDRVG